MLPSQPDAVHTPLPTSGRKPCFFLTFKGSFPAGLNLRILAPPKPASLYMQTWHFTYLTSVQFSSVQFSCSVVSDSLRPHESQHARSPCPSPTPGVHSDSHPWSQWCHPAISDTHNFNGYFTVCTSLFSGYCKTSCLHLCLSLEL